MKRIVAFMTAAAAATTMMIIVSCNIKETEANVILKLDTPKALAVEQKKEPEPEQERELEPEPDHEPEPKTYNGITEGDIITGELTHYCICQKCCGKTDGITASGLKIENGVEPDIPVAACNWLPFGTIVVIDGKTYIIADRGGSELNKIGRLDIFTPEGHRAAIELGRIYGVIIEIISLPEIREEGEIGD